MQRVKCRLLQTNAVCYILYHAIENTTNQNTGKPFYIRRYCIQPSHHAPCVHVALIVLVTLFCMA